MRAVVPQLGSRSITVNVFTTADCKFTRLERVVELRMLRQSSVDCIVQLKHMIRSKIWWKKLVSKVPTKQLSTFSRNAGTKERGCLSLLLAPFLILLNKTMNTLALY